MASQPLRGKTIVVTRPRDQAGPLVDALEASGALVLVVPVIRIEDPADIRPLRRAAERAADFEWIVFTSANGVKRFWQALRRAGLESPHLSGTSLCAIGEATARAIEREGAHVDLIPSEYIAEEVVKSLASSGRLTGVRILLPRAENARDTLPAELKRLGAIVEDVPAYRTVAAAGDIAELKAALDSRAVDMLTFTSGSAVRAFAEHVTADPGSALVATIGPVTSAVANELGWRVTIEAPTHTAGALAEAIVQFYSAGKIK